MHPHCCPAFAVRLRCFGAAGGRGRDGVTVHFMDEQFDTGDVVGQRPFPPNWHHSPELETHLAQIGAELLVETVQRWRLARCPASPSHPVLAAIRGPATPILCWTPADGSPRL
ncbi:MAG: hypothetical protein R3D55_21320 [Chloroflexota bacterium]